ncbi:Peptidase M16 domain protein [Pseudodesulfovibrio profundus]|uniref:Peptidase M16 domain protein n=1 Tax=Pseudodesulfovibrio profundus TaxID=57320 RepID=A0A2C8F4G3_9BACT|nr:pitrilysin family protein [Pseudodesulfovibrio profundus]SOB56898.1 Peptidase M16 domain protein [Pseudodesulfovibrio profundus]
MFQRVLLLGGMLMLLTGCLAHANKTKTMDNPEPVDPMASFNLGGDETHIVKLKNGLTVLIKNDDRFPLVNARLYVHAGSAYETPEIAGISHQLEHMVFKGTEKRGLGESAKAIESVGGSMNAATSFDYTVYYVEVPDAEWKLGLDVITDMAINPTIDPKELESEKKVVLEELERGEDSPNSLLFKSLQSMIWKDTTYEWPIIGYRDTIKAFNREKIMDYIATHYQPQSMMLAVVGKVDPDEVVKEAERLLGGLENTRPVLPPETFTIPEVGTGPVVTKLTGKWNKVYLGAAFPIPGGSSAEYAGLDLLSQLLGGDSTSRFYRKFKYEMHMVDDISVSPLSLERGGMLYIHATLDSENVDEFWMELMKELASFDPANFTDREIERARLNLEDSMFLAKETLSGLASKTAFLQFFEDGEQAEDNYLYTLQQVTRDELRHLYEQFIRPDQLHSVVLTPEENTVSADQFTEVIHQEWPLQKSIQKAQQEETTVEEAVIELPSGNKLVFLPDDTLPYTAISIYWTGGDGILEKDQEGLAALTASALSRGTMSMTATEVQDFLSDHAASLGAKAGRNVFAVESKFPVRFTDKILPLLREVMTAPAFNPEEIERSKRDQIAGIKRREDQPLGLAFRHLFPFLYKSGPYALLHQGQPEGVEQLGQADIMRYWARQSMQPMTIAVCGQFDADVIREFADNLSATLTAPVNEYAFTEPEWNSERTTTMQLPDRKQSHVLMVFPTPGQMDRDTTASLELLRAALSGQSGLLFRDLRDKQGLAYSVTSLLWQSRNTGFLALYIGTNPDTVEQSLDGFRQVVADLAASPLPEEELTRARNILVGDYYQEHQSLISRSRQAASLIARGFDRSYEQEIIEKAKSVSAETIRSVVKEYLDPDKAYLMTVTP